MDDWKPPEYWKRVACIMMIRAGFKNSEILTAARCSLNTVKAVRCELVNCGGDVEAVASRKGHSRRSSNCLRTTKFIAELQEKVQQDPSKSMRALAREMGVGVATMKKALNEDLRYCSYKSGTGGQVLLMTDVEAAPAPVGVAQMKKVPKAENTASPS